MLKETMLYYFSPTGGTKRAAESFCNALAENVRQIDLGTKNAVVKQPDCDMVVLAAPVFGGRIPKVISDKIRKLHGTGRKAVTLVVYGTRAYEDALLELNHVAEECGFEIVASAALIAQHSIVPIVGQGRPDTKDEREIQNFAKEVLEKIAIGNTGKVEVPGNIPYKAYMSVPATPMSTAVCNICRVCENVCPTGAIHVDKNEVVTELEKCIMCMACVAHCHKNGRILPPPVQESMNGKLGVLKDIRRENEYFL